jgi:outer membrane protein, heavy metal efflux system
MTDLSSGARLGLSLLLSASLLGSAAAQSAVELPPANALTLAQALRSAQERSMTLRAQDAQTQAAFERAVAAGQLPDPVLQLSVDSLPVQGPMAWNIGADFMTTRSIGLSQTWTGQDKRRARSAALEREGESAQALRSLRLSELRRDTALAWLDRYYQQQAVDLLARQREETALQVSAAEAAFRAGRGSQADVWAARSAVAQLDNQLLAAQTQLRNAVTALARWVGAQASAPLGAGPDLSRTRWSPEHLTQQLDHHPDLGWLDSQQAQARAEVEKARQEREPDWSVSLMYGRRGAAYADMVSVGLSLPLPWDRANRQDRELKASLARVEQLRAEREEMARVHLAQTQAWWASWHSQRERLDHYDKTLLVLASERSQAALAAYRGGQMPLTGVLEARLQEIELQLERLRLEMSTAALWATLEYLLPVDGDAAAPTVHTEESPR